MHLLIFIAIPLALVSVVLLIALWRNHTSFKDKWPPITDDEFVAGCTPGTSRETALKVRRIVSEQLGVDYDRVHPDQDFVRDLNCS